MDRKFILFSILASILVGGSLGLIPLQNSFADDDNLSVSKEDSEAYKKQLEKAEEKKKKDEERNDKLEEKRKEQQQKDEERNDKLEEKRKEQQQKTEEKRKKLEEKKAKLELDRKKLEEKLIKKINKYEDKLREIKEKYENQIKSDSANNVEKLSKDAAKLEQKIAQHGEKVEKTREKLTKKLENLDTRTQKILDKINDGDYLGKKLGSTTTFDTYELVFDTVTATAINDKTQTSSLTGFMSFTTFDKGKSNLKLELQECQVTVDDVPYNCGFGKARTASSGDSGAKDSLVILAFLEDDVIEEVHSTLKIFLNADLPIREIDGSSHVSILGPQSKIAGMWFLEGDGTLTKVVSDSDDSTDDTDGEHFTISLNDGISAGEK